PDTILQIAKLPTGQAPEQWVAGEREHMAMAPFDLAADDPIRAKLLQLGAEKYQLLRGLHHIAVDGHAVSLLLEELAALYNGDSLIAVSVSYGQYTHWLQQDPQQRLLQRQA